ncbi:putative nuclease HARBI1 [Bicyclus anynana]|uniref:Putative nuclease HARBI1 n=1 Tax=Bicyclus anynana TaxID=110368 RepID=A0A6J1MGW2_BICAN|nr:putative nuclease HARBI1 [Bicyclus anynana]
MYRDYFVRDLRMIDDVEDIINRNPFRKRVKLYKIRKNPLEELQEAEFKLKYRFSRSTAMFIIDMVKNDLSGDSRGGLIPPHLKVLTALRTWVSGEIQDDAGDLNGMSQATVSRVCKQVALALVAKRAEWIHMPHSEIEQDNVIAGFFSICGFRQVIGAIDCTHIRILKVGGNVGQYYINRKGYSSINVQVVSNANLEIMDIVARWCGSTHDSRIFNESPLKQRFEQSEFKGRLLGDSGFACTSYLFTPISQPNTEKEEMYNIAHSKTHNTVERCIKVWKQRFKSLLQGFKTKLDNTKVYIVALAILHNIAIQRQEQLDDVEEHDEVPVPVPPVTLNNMTGSSARAAFINDNF